MKALLAALLLSTATALAQPVVGPEVSTSPLEGLGDYAIAPQHDGFVLAWEQAGRIYAGQLDATLHLTAAPVRLPTADSAAVAVSPAVASNGTSVLVAWHERRPGSLDLAYIALLSADAQTLLRGPVSINFTKDAPLVTSVNGKYVVYTGDLRYRFNENLDIESGVFISHDLNAALNRNGDVASVSESSSAPFSCIQVCFGHPCSGPPTDCTVTSTVRFALPTKLTAETYLFTIPANTTSQDPFKSSPPLIAPHGDSFAGLVELPDRTDLSMFGTFEQYTLAVIARGDAALAGNGQDVLLVWTSPALTGMVVHPDGTSSLPFEISASGKHPKVVAVDSNAFAVIYRIEADSGRSILAGRIVRLQPSKGRAVR